MTKEFPKIIYMSSPAYGDGVRKEGYTPAYPNFDNMPDGNIAIYELKEIKKKVTEYKLVDLE